MKFDTVPNDGDPSVSNTGLFASGQGPFGGYDMLKNGVKLRNQHPFGVDMKYNGRLLQVRITDVVNGATSHQSYTVNIPRAIGSRTAFVGFTVATGFGSSAQDLLKWYFAAPPLLYQGSSASGNEWRRRDAPASLTSSKRADGRSLAARAGAERQKPAGLNRSRIFRDSRTYSVGIAALCLLRSRALHRFEEFEDVLGFLLSGFRVRNERNAVRPFGVDERGMRC